MDRSPDEPTTWDGETRHPVGCPRGRADCEPLSRRASEDYRTYMCCGENDGSHGGPDQDRWRFCMVSEDGVDFLVNLDERDMIDSAAVLLSGLSYEAQGWIGGRTPDPDDPPTEETP